MRYAVSEAWVLARILLRFVAIGVLAWVAAVSVSRGGAWYLLAIPFGLLALFQLVLSSVILWTWAVGLRSGAATR
jgi:hypothetical protein